jgi:hypothetical protein
MGTKLIIYTIMFDIFLSLLVGAYSSIAPPSFPPIPTENAAIQIVNITWVFGWPTLTVWPQFTLIPSFTLIPQFGFPGGPTFGPVVTPALQIPAFQIPAVTFFTLNWAFLWPVILVFLYVGWIFVTIGDVVGYLLSIFTSSITLLTNVPMLGPFLTTLVLIVNFVLVWELVKLIRGNEG